MILEFSADTVASGLAPAELCQILYLKHSTAKYMNLADKIYTINEEKLTGSYIKNRSGQLQDFIISGEDILALALKAVVL